jgi:hypothetical protein
LCAGQAKDVTTARMIPDPEGSGRQVLVDLALQGGGAHGAFTWGVLDRLLDEAWLRIEGILPSLRTSFDAGANASVLPALSVASLVGFGAVVAALPAFGMVRDFVLTIEGGPLVSLALRSCPGRVDGLGVRRSYDRARCPRRNLPAARRSKWHGSRAHASGRGG